MDTPESDSTTTTTVTIIAIVIISIFVISLIVAFVILYLKQKKLDIIFNQSPPINIQKPSTTTNGGNYGSNNLTKFGRYAF